MDFLNKRISTLTGIIVLLIVSFAVGAFLLQQMKQIVDIRVNILQSIQN